MSYNPLFPDVPMLPGVPQLLRQLPSLAQVAIPLIADALGLGGLFNAGPQWGIFDQSGGLVIEPDSFKDLNYKHDWRLPNYPMEKGAFQSYNKVQTPFATRIAMTKGGSPGEIETFLNDVEDAADSTDLFDIVSPEYVYTNCSIEGIDYQRSSKNGVSLLTVELTFLEIRLAPSTNGTPDNSLFPNGANILNGGFLQSIPLTIGNSLTSSIIKSAVGGGIPLASVLQSNTVLASSSVGLLPKIISPIISTVTPFSTKQINASIFPPSGVGLAVAAQAAQLRFFQ